MDVERLIVRLVADATLYTHVLDTAQARLVYFAGAVTAAFTRQAAVMAAAYEKSAIAFEVMTKSSTLARNLLADLNKMAVETPFHSADLVDYARELKSFGTETDNIIPTLHMLGEVASGTGGRMDRIILAFGQVQTAGRLMGQELRQFTNAGIPLMEYLAAVMGKPVDQVTHLVHTGQVGFPLVVQAFKRMTEEGGRFHGLMERINQETTAGRFENLTEKVQLKMRDVGLGFFEEFRINEVMDAIGNKIGGVTQNQTIEFFRGLRQTLDITVEVGRRFIQFIRDAYEWTLKIGKSVADWLKAHQDLVRTIAITVGLVLAWNVAMRVIAATVVYVTTLVGFLTRVVQGFYALLTVVRFVGYAIAGLDAAVSLFFSVVLSPLGIIVGLVAALVYYMNELGSFDRFGMGGLATWRDFSGGLVEQWKLLVETIKGGDMEAAINIVINTVKFGWKMLMTMLRVEWNQFWSELPYNVLGALGKMGVEIAAFMGRLMTYIAQLVVGAVGGFVAELVGLFDKAAGEKIRGKVNEIMQGITADRQDIRDKTAAAVAEIQGLVDKQRAAMQPGIDRENVAIRAQGLAEAMPYLIDSRIQAVLAGLEARDMAKNVNTFAAAYGTRMPAEAFPGSPVGGGSGLAGIAGAAGVQGQYAKTFQDAVFYVALLREAVGKNLAPELMKDYVAAANNATKKLRDLEEAIKGVSDKAGAPAVLVPLSVAGKTIDMVGRLGKEMEDNITPMERFTQSIARLREAVQGPFPNLREIMAGAAAPVGGMPGFVGGLGMPLFKPLIDREQLRAGLLFRFQDMVKAVKGGDEHLPPTAFEGTQQAQDIINRSRDQGLSLQEDMNRTLREVFLTSKMTEGNTAAMKDILEKMFNDGKLDGIDFFH